MVVIGAGFAGLSAVAASAGPAGGGHHRRPQQLPHVPTAALPGRHRRARRLRRRLSRSHHHRPRARRRVPPRPGRVDRRRRTAGRIRRRHVARLRRARGRDRGHHGVSSRARCRTSTRFPSTHSPTPANCGTTFSVASRRRTPVPRTSTAGLSPSWWSVAVPPGWRSRGRSSSCSTWPFAATASASTRTSKVVLVDAGDRLLPGFHEGAGRYALETLRSRGVDVRLGRRWPR